VDADDGVRFVAKRSIRWFLIVTVTVGVAMLAQLMTYFVLLVAYRIFVRAIPWLVDGVSAAGVSSWALRIAIAGLPLMALHVVYACRRVIRHFSREGRLPDTPAPSFGARQRVLSFAADAVMMLVACVVVLGHRITDADRLLALTMVSAVLVHVVPVLAGIFFKHVLRPIRRVLDRLDEETRP
jgi:hypothetical protein